MARITNRLLNVKPTSFRLTLREAQALTWKLLESSFCWPEAFNKAWSSLHSKETILCDVVLDGLHSTMQADAHFAAAQHILDNLSRADNIYEVLDWMQDLTELPPRSILNQLRTNPPKDLAQMKVYAFEKVKEKVAHLDAGAAPKVEASASEPPAKAKAKGHLTIVKTEGKPPALPPTLKETPLVEAKKALQSLNAIESELTMQAYVGRLNKAVVWPALEAAGVKRSEKTSMPKREIVDNRTTITYFTKPVAPTKAKEEVIMTALRQALGGMYKGASVRDKSVSIVFNNFPEA